MVYVYDILVNLDYSGRMYDFFEWDNSDNIVHIKRIPLFKVSSDILNNIYSSVFKVSSDFLVKIKDLTEVYRNKKIEKFTYASLFTDGKKVLAIGFDESGKSIIKSVLLLDEEDEVIDLSSRMDNSDINLVLVNKELKHDFITRGEEEIRDFLRQEIEASYRNQDINKLKYIYVEYFNDNKDNVDKIYRELLNSLRYDINERHSLIYNLLKMSYSKR